MFDLRDHGKPTKPNAFVTRVHAPRNRRMTKPPNIVFISGMPLCLAYIAYSLTSVPAKYASDTYTG